MNTETEDNIIKKSHAQIKLDLSRSYPNCEYFSEGGIGQKEMENVLIAYSKYDAKVGYVQGMNFIVGALLYHCSEEIAFWIFVTLIDYYGIRDVYSPGLPGLYEHTRIIDSLISKNLKRVYQHSVNCF